MKLKGFKNVIVSSQLHFERLFSRLKAIKGVKTFSPKLNWRAFINCTMFADSSKTFLFLTWSRGFQISYLIWT